MKQLTLPRLSKRNLILIGILLLTVLALYFLRRPKAETVIETAEQQLLCTRWRSDIDLQLSSLKTQYITDRDLYLLQAHNHLKNTVETELNHCAEKLENFDTKTFKKDLESLAIQLSQKDDKALKTIDAMKVIFTD